MEIEFVCAAPPGMPVELMETIEPLRAAFRNSRVQSRPCESAPAWWCESFGVLRQADWPVAPLRQNEAQAGQHYWLCADPQHLRIDGDRLLFDSDALGDLDMAQAQALVDELNAHFGADGLQFVTVSPREWLLRVPRTLELSAHAPDQAQGLPASRTQPRGADAAWARRLGSEIQMVLHQARGNAGREARRQWPVNSVWLWGGGHRPVQLVKDRPAVMAAQPGPLILTNQAFLRGLSEISGFHCDSLTIDWESAIKEASKFPANKVLIDLTEIAQNESWTIILSEKWLLPAAQSARSRKSTFWITLLVAGRALRVRAQHRDLLHLFCRKSLAQYIDNIQN